MRIITGAQANGFGPVSKLVTIAKLLGGAEKLFVGEGSALEFARRHASHFTRPVERGGADEGLLDSLILGSDFGLLVMDHELAFRLATLKRPYYFFDSLFGFWLMRHEAAEIVGAARRIPGLEPAAARALFDSFSVHEQKVISHVMARRSFAQNFAGVRERVELLARQGVGHVRLIGPIIDTDAADAARPDAEGAAAPDAASRPGRGWQMLINLCGVKNYILDYHRNDYYVDLLERWARDFLSARPDCGEVLICCGRYTEPDARPVGAGVLRRRFLAHDEFIRAVTRADVFLCAPGLTSINEAVRLGRLPVLLPEQHYSQFYNLSSLRGTALGGLSLSNGELFDDYQIPEHDYRGSEAIIDYTRRLYESEQDYEKFRRALDERVERALGLSPGQRQAALAEVLGMFEGARLQDAVGEMLEDFRR